MIPAGFLQDLLTRVDVVDVVGRHVELKRGGANFMGLCPFHTEKSPSFSVNPAKQFYYCFGCAAGGDAIRFLTEHLGLSFIEAVRDLAQGAGLTVPEEQLSPEDRQRRETLRQRRLSLADVLARATAFYRAQLKAEPRAVGYLKQRGLTGRIAAHYGLGWAPPGWRALAGVFPDYEDPLLEEAGLVRQREPADTPASEPATTGSVDPGRGRYDWFRERVMFPIRGVDGTVIGFGGRVLDDSRPKYINSPETPLFSKGRELYGLYEARQALREHGHVLVVEGYMDVVALAQSGFANAVATLGTACTADHVQKLFRHTDAVVFAFDGDAAGRRAATRALEAALPHVTDLRNVRFLFLPPEHDPDSYVRQLGPEAFRKQVEQAVPLSRQLVEQAAADTDAGSAEGRARMLAQARPLWTALADGALKRQLLPELARRANLEIADLVALWGGAAQPAARPRPLPLQAPLRRAGRRPPAAPADLALRLLLRHSDWWERLGAEDQGLLHGLGGDHSAVVGWLDRWIAEHGPGTWATLEATMASEPWHAHARAWVEAAAPDEEQGFEDLLRVLHRLWIERLGAQAQALADSGQDLAALRRINDRIALLKSGLVALAATQKPRSG